MSGDDFFAQLARADTGPGAVRAPLDGTAQRARRPVARLTPANPGKSRRGRLLGGACALLVVTAVLSTVLLTGTPQESLRSQAPVRATRSAAERPKPVKTAQPAEAAAQATTARRKCDLTDTCNRRTRRPSAVSPARAGRRSAPRPASRARTARPARRSATRRPGSRRSPTTPRAAPTAPPTTSTTVRSPVPVATAAPVRLRPAPMVRARVPAPRAPVALEPSCEFPPC